MTIFSKLDQIRAHLRPDTAPARVSTLDGGKRVQKNLSILESDAERLATLAKRDGLSQARLLSAALDAYEDKMSDFLRPVCPAQPAQARRSRGQD